MGGIHVVGDIILMVYAIVIIAVIFFLARMIIRIRRNSRGTH